MAPKFDEKGQLIYTVPFERITPICHCGFILDTTGLIQVPSTSEVVQLECPRCERTLIARLWRLIYYGESR